MSLVLKKASVTLRLEQTPTLCVFIVKHVSIYRQCCINSFRGVKIRNAGRYLSLSMTDNLPSLKSSRPQHIMLPVLSEYTFLNEYIEIIHFAMDFTAGFKLQNNNLNVEKERKRNFYKKAVNCLKRVVITASVKW